MKKLFTFLKVLFVILLAVFLIFAGIIFYAYTKINNISDYADRFTYNYAAHQEEERNFDSCVFFDQKNSALVYDVPAYYLYDVITPDSLKEFLGFPEEFTISKVGIEPDLDDMKVRLYLSVKYGELLNTCMVIDTDLALSEDRNQLEMRFADFFAVDEKTTAYLKENAGPEKGSLMYAHRFPSDVPYYLMDRYYPECVGDLSFDGETLHAKYDFERAVKKYLEDQPMENIMFEEYMEKLLPELDAAGIAHS